MKQKRKIAGCLAAFLLLMGMAAPHAYAEEKAKATILMEANTGAILSGENENAQLSVAGLPKLMAYVLFFQALEKGTVQPNDIVQISKEAAGQGGTQVFLDAGAAYSFETLLKPAILASANDAVVALAEHLAGSEQAFVNQMNQKAKELGLDCVFYDATGQSKKTTMSAKDLGKTACALCKYPGFFQYSSIWMEPFLHESGRETQMVNSNRLIQSQGFDGMATGSTPDSGYSLVASYQNGTARYLSVVLGAKDKNARFSIAKAQIAEADASHLVKQIAKAGSRVASVPIKDGREKNVNLLAEQDCLILLSKDQEAALQKQIETKELTAPVHAGEKAGELRIQTEDGKEYIVALVAEKDVEQLSFASCFHRILMQWQHRIDKNMQ